MSILLSRDWGWRLRSIIFLFPPLIIVGRNLVGFERRHSHRRCAYIAFRIKAQKFINFLDTLEPIGVADGMLIVRLKLQCGVSLCGCMYVMTWRFR